MMVNVSGLPTLTNGMDSVPMAIYVVRHMVCRSAALADPGSFRIKPGWQQQKRRGLPIYHLVSRPFEFAGGYRCERWNGKENY